MAAHSSGAHSSKSTRTCPRRFLGFGSGRALGAGLSSRLELVTQRARLALGLGRSLLLPQGSFGTLVDPTFFLDFGAQCIFFSARGCQRRSRPPCSGKDGLVLLGTAVHVPMADTARLAIWPQLVSTNRSDEARGHGGRGCECATATTTTARAVLPRLCCHGWLAGALRAAAQGGPKVLFWDETQGRPTAAQLAGSALIDAAHHAFVAALPPARWQPAVTCAAAAWRAACGAAGALVGLHMRAWVTCEARPPTRLRLRRAANASRGARCGLDVSTARRIAAAARIALAEVDGGAEGGANRGAAAAVLLAGLPGATGGGGSAGATRSLPTQGTVAEQPDEAHDGRRGGAVGPAYPAAPALNASRARTVAEACDLEEAWFDLVLRGAGCAPPKAAAAAFAGLGAATRAYVPRPRGPRGAEQVALAVDMSLLDGATVFVGRAASPLSRRVARMRAERGVATRHSVLLPF